MQETGNTLLTNNSKDADGCRTARGQGAGDLCGNIMHDTPSVEDRRGGLKVSGTDKGPTMQGTGWDTNNPWQLMPNTRCHKEPWF